MLWHTNADVVLVLLFNPFLLLSLNQSVWDRWFVSLRSASFLLYSTGKEGVTFEFTLPPLSSRNMPGRIPIRLTRRLVMSGALFMLMAVCAVSVVNIALQLHYIQVESAIALQAQRSDYNNLITRFQRSKHSFRLAEPWRRLQSRIKGDYFEVEDYTRLEIRPSFRGRYQVNPNARNCRNNVFYQRYLEGGVVLPVQEAGEAAGRSST